jgi:hypothetical protein
LLKLEIYRDGEMQTGILQEKIKGAIMNKLVTDKLVWELPQIIKESLNSVSSGVRRRSVNDSNHASGIIIPPPLHPS